MHTVQVPSEEKIDFSSLASSARESEQKADRERKAREEAEGKQRILSAQMAHRKKASDDWRSLQPALGSGGSEIAVVVHKYIGKYKSSTVSVDGVVHQVSISEVSQAQKWLREFEKREKEVNSRGKRASGGSHPATVQGKCGYEMVLCLAGTFWMRSNYGKENKKPVHKVTLSRPFYMGRFQVTQSLWEWVMGSNPSHFRKQGWFFKKTLANHPVDSVSWFDVVADPKVSVKRRNQLWREHVPLWRGFGYWYTERPPDNGAW